MLRRRKALLIPGEQALGELSEKTVDDLYDASGLVCAQENQNALQTTRDNYVFSVYTPGEQAVATGRSLERRSYIATVYHLAGLATETVIAHVPPATLESPHSSLLIVNYIGGKIMEIEASMRLSTYEQIFRELTDGDDGLVRRYKQDRRISNFPEAASDHAEEVAAHAMLKFEQPFSGDEAVRSNMDNLLLKGFDYALQTEELIGYQEYQRYLARTASKE